MVRIPRRCCPINWNVSAEKAEKAQLHVLLIYTPALTCESCQVDYAWGKKVLKNCGRDERYKKFTVVPFATWTFLEAELIVGQPIVATNPICALHHNGYSEHPVRTVLLLMKRANRLYRDSPSTLGWHPSLHLRFQPSSTNFTCAICLGCCSTHPSTSFSIRSQASFLFFFATGVCIAVWQPR